jgi:hypothetical protein
MTKLIDPRQTWWFWRAVQERLTTFALALLSPLRDRRYQIRLKPEGTGYCDPRHHVIQVNPVLFAEEGVTTQFRATQGLLAHEVAHGLFTGSWPEAHEDVLCQLTNLLEDERIERLIVKFYPGIAPAITLLGDLSYRRFKSHEADPRDQALGCCLAWRWAHGRTSENQMLRQLKVSTDGQRVWALVRPFVEEAWDAADTHTVIALARHILEMLGLPCSARPLATLLAWSSLRGVPAVRDGEPMTISGACESLQPGLGVAGSDDLPVVEEDQFLRPKPYLALEDAARPLARQLAEALKEPEQDVRLLPHEWRGRFGFRQELRTPETPCLFAQGIDRAPRSVAIYVLVDRSGSMGALEAQVQLALMTLYLAATELAIPVGMAAFGADNDRDEDALTFPLTESLFPLAQETTKALIAGYRGATAAEFLFWGLQRAESELAAQPERLKLLIVLHDGQPVYSGRRGYDWELSLRHLRHLDDRGITPVGVYLGADTDDEHKLKTLFRWLIVCSPEQLPERLGDLLRSLV